MCVEILDPVLEIGSRDHLTALSEYWSTGPSTGSLSYCALQCPKNISWFSEFLYSMRLYFDDLQISLKETWGIQKVDTSEIIL